MESASSYHYPLEDRRASFMKISIFIKKKYLFTIIPSYAHRENGLRAFLVVNGQKVVASTPKTARNAPDLFYAYAWLCTPPHSR